MIYRNLETDGVPAPSDFELARITGRRIAEYDADTTAPDWPGFDVEPTTRCNFDFFVQYENLNDIRPYVWQWIEDNCEPVAPGEKRIYTIARWNSLKAMYEHQREAEDARDEAETMADVRAAGHW